MLCSVKYFPSEKPTLPAPINPIVNDITSIPIFQKTGCYTQPVSVDIQLFHVKQLLESVQYLGVRRLRSQIFWEMK